MTSSLNCWAAIVLHLVQSNHHNGRPWINQCFKFQMVPVLLVSEASLGPYAWQYNGTKKLKLSHGNATDPNPENLPVANPATRSAPPGKRVVSEGVMFKDTYLQYDDVASLPRSQDVFRRIELDPCMGLRLPKPGSTAGTVLKHCAQVFEDLLRKNKPMTFKFGISHDPCVRWHNSRFGYKYGKDPFECMTIVYTASNGHGPAFLEAALIDRYGSFLIAIYSLPICWSICEFTFLQEEDFMCAKLAVHVCSMFPCVFSCFLSFCSVLCGWGLQGCKNELRGGDSLRDCDEGPYFTYIVHMSWKRPSMQLRSLARTNT